MSRREVSFPKDLFDDDLPTIPGLASVFDHDDLSGSLFDFPTAPDTSLSRNLSKMCESKQANDSHHDTQFAMTLPFQDDEEPSEAAKLLAELGQDFEHNLGQNDLGVLGNLTWAQIQEGWQSDPATPSHPGFGFDPEPVQRSQSAQENSAAKQQRLGPSRLSKYAGSTGQMSDETTTNPLQHSAGQEMTHRNLSKSPTPVANPLVSQGAHPKAGKAAQSTSRKSLPPSRLQSYIASQARDPPAEIFSSRLVSSQAARTTPEGSAARQVLHQHHGPMLSDSTQHLGEQSRSYPGNTSNPLNIHSGQSVHDTDLEFAHLLNMNQFSDTLPLHAHQQFRHSGFHGQAVDTSVHNALYGSEMVSGHPTVGYAQSRPAEYLQESYYGQQEQAMKQEESSPEPPARRLVYESSAQAREARNSNAQLPDDDTKPVDIADDKWYIDMFVTAMLDMENAEDNKGMKDTWTKIMADVPKVEQGCWALLEVVKRAYAQVTPLVPNNKTNTQYQTFLKRVEAICTGLRTQKTMCKHLMAPPYVDQLVDDPANAVTRIRNNRKVNHGKKVAIQKGRSALGEKGQGKGKRNTKVAKKEVQDEEFAESDLEFSSTLGTTEAAPYNPPVVPAPKRTRQTESEESTDHDDHHPMPPKKAKKSRYQLNTHGEMVDTSRPALPAQPSQSAQSLPGHPGEDPDRRQNPYPVSVQQRARLNPNTDQRFVHPHFLRLEQPLPEYQTMLTDFDDPGFPENLAEPTASGNEADRDDDYATTPRYLPRAPTARERRRR